MSAPNRGKGKAVQWLRDHANYDGEGCLVWPFSRSRQTGYCMFGYLGKMQYGHRFMCELVNGPPPTPDHEAAHSCGNGHGGCLHPKHLDWKTVSQNLLDCRGHGTQVRNRRGPAGTLTPIQVAEIRALKGSAPQREIGQRYGVSASTVRDILSGRSHKQERRMKVVYTPAQVLEIRRIGLSKSIAELARIFGGSEAAIYRVRSGKSFKHLGTP